MTMAMRQKLWSGVGLAFNCEPVEIMFYDRKRRRKSGKIYTTTERDKKGEKRINIYVYI